MIIGTGIDVIDVYRIENTIKKYGDRFINRCFTEKEIIGSKKKFNNISFFAKRYAAKEACAKALGTGLARGVYWKDISVSNNNLGKPFIEITGKALERLKKMSNKKCNIEVSLSDEKHYAIANVIIFETNEKN